MAAQTEEPVVGLVLAAGYARRFGSDKRLAPFDRQHCLLSKVVELAATVCSQVFVVVRPEDEAQLSNLVARWRQTGVEPVKAVNALQGMGASLSDGIQAVVASELERGQRYSGVMVLLADMPYIQPATLEQLLMAHQPDKITLPCYRDPHKENRWGHPVIFGRRWYSKLKELQGDRGGRAIVRAHPTSRIPVVVEDKGVLRDVDTPEDLAG